jgi:hypothetical protein
LVRRPGLRVRGELGYQRRKRALPCLLDDRREVRRREVALAFAVGKGERPDLVRVAGGEDLDDGGMATCGREEPPPANLGRVADVRGEVDLVILLVSGVRASAEPRETPAIDPETWAALKAQIEAARQARREASARLTPVTDAEIARYGADAQPGPEPGVPGSGQDRSEALAGLREDVGELGSKVDELARHDAGRTAERAEIVQAAIDEPSVPSPGPSRPLSPPGSRAALRGSTSLTLRLRLSLRCDRTPAARARGLTRRSPDGFEHPLLGGRGSS